MLSHLGRVCLAGEMSSLMGDVGCIRLDVSALLRGVSQDHPDCDVPRLYCTAYFELQTRPRDFQDRCGQPKAMEPRKMAMQEQ